MRKTMIQLAVLAAVVPFSLPAWSVQAVGDYHFHVLYNGNDPAALAAGSDDPTSTVLFPGDGFEWSIMAQNGAAWTVLQDVGLFPLMAFGTWESADRVGDYVLSLRKGATEVLHLAQTGAGVSEVHIGTNTVFLSAGLRFDSMHLQYRLTSSLEVPGNAADPDNLPVVPTTPSGLLPIFGAPDQMSPAVIYGAVPEPATWALLLAGAGLLGWRARHQG